MNYPPTKNNNFTPCEPFALAGDSFAGVIFLPDYNTESTLRTKYATTYQKRLTAGDVLNGHRYASCVTPWTNNHSRANQCKPLCRINAGTVSTGQGRISLLSKLA